MSAWQGAATHPTYRRPHRIDECVPGPDSELVGLVSGLLESTVDLFDFDGEAAAFEDLLLVGVPCDTTTQIGPLTAVANCSWWSAFEVFRSAFARTCSAVLVQMKAGPRRLLGGQNLARVMPRQFTGA